MKVAFPMFCPGKGVWNMKKIFRFTGMVILFAAICVCADRWIGINGTGSDSAGVHVGEEAGREEIRTDFKGDDAQMGFTAGEETWSEEDVENGSTMDTAAEESEGAGEAADAESGGTQAGRASAVYRDRARGAGTDTPEPRRYEADAQDMQDHDAQEDAAYRETGYIFMGDSRFYLMNQDCGIDARRNFFVVACPGMGYSWMIVEALPKITSIQNAHPEIGNWVIISGLGINDMEHIQSYLDTYKVLAKNMSLVLLSVNPVSGPVEWGYGNGTIDAFNDRLKRLASRESSVKYINCHDYLVHKGYTTTDGLHYDAATNYDIYLFILNSLNLSG